MFPSRHGTVTGHSKTTASGMVPSIRYHVETYVSTSCTAGLDRYSADAMPMTSASTAGPRTPPPAHPRSETRHAVPGEDRGAQQNQDVGTGRHAQAAVWQHPLVEQAVDPSVRPERQLERQQQSGCVHDPAAIEWRPEPDDQERGGDQPRKEMPLGHAESMRPAIQAIARGRAHEILQRGAVPGNLARGPVAHPAAVAQVRQRIQREHDHRREQHQRARSDAL